ncbi:MAG: hypothetical protein RTU09_04280 [Candidatus Thorarchaeota archaeon]
MTEAAESAPENIEFLRARFRELKVQAREDLEGLRRNRDKMREYKMNRDEHNKEVRRLIESVKAEREERDRINMDIGDAKHKRTAIHAQIKSVYEEIRELRDQVVGSPSNDQRRMMHRVNELEWRQQTEQLSIEDERFLVEEITVLEKQLVKIGLEKEKQDKIHELRRMARRLKDEASDAHQIVIELSEKSQIHHQEVVRIRPELEEYKKAADTAHKNFVEWLKKVKDGEDKLKIVRTEIDEIYNKLRKLDVGGREAVKTAKRTQQREQEQVRVEAAVEKLQAGGRLTFDEFILAQRVSTDDGGSRRGKPRKRAKKESFVEKASAEDSKSVDETAKAKKPAKSKSRVKKKPSVEKAPAEDVKSADEPAKTKKPAKSKSQVKKKPSAEKALTEDTKPVDESAEIEQPAEITEEPIAVEESVESNEPVKAEKSTEVVETVEATESAETKTDESK